MKFWTVLREFPKINVSGVEESVVMRLVGVTLLAYHIAFTRRGHVTSQMLGIISK